MAKTSDQRKTKAQLIEELQGLRQQVAALQKLVDERKWAEVLSADAFSAFEESGIFNQDTGNRFMNTILAQGGSREPMELFVEFRGREPSIDALLRHSGLAA